MRYKSLKLFSLLIMMSVLSSSSDEASINPCKQAAAKQACSETRSEFAVSVPCKHAFAAPAKKDDADIIAEADNELSLSPISRFILLP